MTLAGRLSPRRLLSAVGRRLPGRRTARPEPRHHHHRFTESELLARADEFNRNAEKHWQAIAADPAGRGHVLNKPLSTVQDTGAILYRLGLVVQELHLGLGHTVLDFAAGSCWLSSHLNRLRCRTVSVDVSVTSLRLGREMFAMDPRHRLDLQPLFVPYDGTRLPLRDESVDRIACFDAFHHVPNQDDVLREMCRVLRPGGRAVFAEPGEGHSHTDQSEFEMDRFGVLENDLHLDEVVAKARRAGFDGAYVKPYPDPGALTFAADDFARFMDGDDRTFPLSVLRESLRHFFVFVLTKGEEVYDSRNPRTLKAEITLLEPERLRTATAGQHLSLRARARNTGDSIWRHKIVGVGGYVMLGAHLYGEAGQPVTPNLSRAALPRDVAPGETVELDLDVPVPERRGRFVLRLDMVSEWLAWFAQVGSPTPEYPLVVEGYADSRAPHRLRAHIERLTQGPLRSGPGAALAVPLRVTNTGDTVWREAPAGAPGTVALGGHLQDTAGASVSYDFFRAPLWRGLGPDESAEGTCTFAAPPVPGRYRLEIDLVAEGVCWFAHHGSPTAWLDVEVTDEVPDSRHPGVLRAEIVPTGGRPLRVSAGDTVRLEVRVTNHGNTRWLHEKVPEGGYVALGGHLKDDTGALVDLDFLRAALPRAVAPGETAVVIAEVQGPARPGQYRLELDMVDEGVAWFAQRGSASVEVDLLVS